MKKARRAGPREHVLLILLVAVLCLTLDGLRLFALSTSPWRRARGADRVADITESAIAELQIPDALGPLPEHLESELAELDEERAARRRSLSALEAELSAAALPPRPEDLNLELATLARECGVLVCGNDQLDGPELAQLSRSGPPQRVDSHELYRILTLDRLDERRFRRLQLRSSFAGLHRFADRLAALPQLAVACSFDVERDAEAAGDWLHTRLILLAP